MNNLSCTVLMSIEPDGPLLRSCGRRPMTELEHIEHCTDGPAHIG